MATDILDREDQDRRTARARRMVLLAFVVQALVSVLVLFFALELVFRNYLVAGPVSAAVAIGGLLYAWYWAWVPVRDGQFRRAIVPTLLLGLLGIPFGLVVVGVVYILAYLRVREVVDRSDQPY